MVNEMRWIPVEERLPEDAEEVLVLVWQDDSWGGGHPIDEYNVDIAWFHKSSYGYIQVDGGSFSTCNDWCEGQPTKILAWMPTSDLVKLLWLEKK